MKATGMVRRIQVDVILTQKCDKAIQILGLRAIFVENFLTKNSIF